MKKPDLLQVLLVMGLALQAFFYWPWAVIPYEVPKVWLLLGWITLMGVILVFRPLPPEVSKRIAQLDRKGWLLIGLFGLAAVVSSFLGEDWPKSVIGNHYRVDGLVTLSSLIAFAGICSVVVSNKLRDRLALAMAAGTGLLQLWALGSFFTLHALRVSEVVNWAGAVGVSFGQPNFLAGYLLLCLPFFWYLWQKEGNASRRALYVLAMCTLCLAILATYSWGAFGGIGLFAFLVLMQQRVPQYRLAWLAGTASAILIFWGVSVAKDYDSAIFESRYRIYSHVLQGAAARPVLGWGVANTDYAFNYSAQRQGYFHDVYVDKAHSELLEVGTTMGGVGLAAYLLLLVYTGQRLMQKGSRQPWYQAMAMLFLLFVYYSQTNVLSISQQLLFWLAIGVALPEKE